MPLSLTKGGVAATYRYDQTGLRITKQGGSGNTEVYLRDGGVELAVLVVNGCTAAARGRTPLRSQLRVLAEPWDDVLTSLTCGPPAT